MPSARPNELTGRAEGKPGAIPHRQRAGLNILTGNNG